MPGFQRLPCRVACSTSSSAAAFPPPNRNLTSSASSWWTSLKSREEEDSLDTRVAPEAPPSTGPTEAHKREMHAVNVAVAVNITIMIAKLGAWFVTSSGALLAETMHSMADVMNQLLLRAGLHLSRRAPTKQHPYGFHKEKYIYALMSAVGIFCLGAGAAVVHGIQSLFDPPQLENMVWSLGVLAASCAAEVYSLRIALQNIRIGAKEQGQTFWGFLRRGRDPTTAAVFAEDAGAVAGLVIAGTATYCSWVTGLAYYDAIGSISVGLLMGGIAMALIRNNMRFLRGQAMDPETHGRIVKHLVEDPVVLNVIDPKSEEMGDGVYRFKAEIQWSGDIIVRRYLREHGRAKVYDGIRAQACSLDDKEGRTALEEDMDQAMMSFGRGVIRTVGEEIDRLESELKAMVPGLVYVDLETDKGRAEKAMAQASIAVMAPLSTVLRPTDPEAP